MIQAPTHVIDASALLALLHGEPGAGPVEEVIEGAVMSAVNWSEVVQKSLARDVSVTGLRADVEALGLSIWPFTAADADAAASLWAGTRQHGLSLADRACLALAKRLDATAVTAERVWRKVITGVTIETIR